MFQKVREKWADATLRELFERGESGVLSMPPKMLADTLEESGVVGDSYYEFAELDRTLARALAEGPGPEETAPNPAAEALLDDGFEDRVSHYLKSGARDASGAAWAAFAAIVVAMLFVVIGPLRGTPENDPIDESYLVRGPDADARTIANLLCIDGDEVLVRPDGIEASCSLDAIFQPTFRDERARGLSMVVFAIGPDGSAIPIIPNPAQTDAHRLEAHGGEQTIGPPRSLAVNYGVGTTRVFFLGSVHAIDWTAVAPLLDELEGGADLDQSSIRAAATATLGFRPDLLREIPLHLSAE